MSVGARTRWGLAACLFCAVASGADLGRLFTTPHQRSDLDRPPGAREERNRRMVEVQGVMVRRGGEPRAWVDDTPLGRGDPGRGFVLLDADREGALILREDSPPAPRRDPDDEGREENGQ